MSVSRHAARAFRSLRSERRTLQQGLVALGLSTVAGFAAGLILAHLTRTLDALPGLIVLIPAAVGMRGTIFGAVGARLGTSIHAGTYEATLRRGGVLRDNAGSAALTTLTSSLWLAALARLVAPAFGSSSISFWQLVTISVIGGALGSVIIMLVTIGISALSFRWGWDLDAVGTPMVTALGDMVTLPTLFIATLVARNPMVNAVSAGLCVTTTVAAVVYAARRGSPGMQRIARQMTAVIVLTPLLDVAAGALLHAEQAALVAQPGLLILIPPFVSQAGALGGIFSSRISSKLQLGVISPGRMPEPAALIDAAIVVIFGAVVFLAVGVGATVLADATTRVHPGAIQMVGGTMLAGAFVMPVVLLVGYGIATASARYGLDPDDQSVPVITSAMDLAGVIAVLVSMSLLGVLAAGA